MVRAARGSEGEIKARAIAGRDLASGTRAFELPNSDHALPPHGRPCVLQNARDLFRQEMMQDVEQQHDVVPGAPVAIEQAPRPMFDDVVDSLARGQISRSS